ncbi:MAG: AbrB/MazE/SpoVT family DNA-binding domain-containing protein [Proteobacteria bacterium]|nr:AbrB/MazE/SpoVT family DNA-binding domain-containing protein [Pseudomonadota bacterium]
MHGQVQKWGNSLGVRIPKTIAKKLQLHSGSLIELDMINHGIVITKSSLELDLLLDRIDSTNCHHEIFYNDSNIGKESW